MKTKSYLKAVASGLIWGLGQVFNRQYWKALFFNVFFVALIILEIATSSYTKQISAYDKLPGGSFGDSWYQLTFMNNTYRLKYPTKEDGYQPFEAYLDEIGYYEDESKLTEEAFITFLAQELKENNPITYSNIQTNQVFMKEQFETANEVRTELTIRQRIFANDVGQYFYERERKDEDGKSIKEYVQTNILSTMTYVEGETIVLSTNEGLSPINKTGTIYKSDGNYYVQVKVMDQVLENGEFVTKEVDKYLELKVDNPAMVDTLEGAVKYNVIGPFFDVGGVIYEYYAPGTQYLGEWTQYRTTPFMNDFREAMRSTYRNPIFNRYNNSDYTQLTLKVYFELNPEVKTNFETGYNNFFYDKAGLFVKGYWSVITLGETKKVDYVRHRALTEAMVGTSSDAVNLVGDVTIAESIPLQGHISTTILLEGLISVILSVFFFIFMIWSIRDAYKVSEARRKKEEVLNTKKYFKSVYENGFEYIVLSPALFVLAFISIMPIMFGFVIAFTSISGNQSMIDTFDWVGLKNFVSIFSFSSDIGKAFGPAFWRVLIWTIIWAVFSTATVFFGGFLQALILNSEKVVFRKVWRTILILPWAIPALLSQMVFRVMFQENGFINQLLADIGVENVLRSIGFIGRNYSELSGISRYFYLGANRVQWFDNPFNPTFVKTMLIIINIWLGFPYFMALMTGIMTAIDKSLYEAADIDGATGYQKITKITMPLMLYSTAPILIMTFSGNFNNFGVIYFITGGGPNAGYDSRGFAGDTDILISWMYKLTVDYSTYNMASVFSVLIFIFVGSITAWNLSRTRAFQED